MPRKTKHQKILAELRTLKGQIQAPVVGNNNSSEPAGIPTHEAISPTRLSSLLNTPTRSNPTNTVSLDYNYIFKDLRKVAVLATVALLIELVASLTLNVGFANLLKDLKLF